MKFAIVPGVEADEPPLLQLEVDASPVPPVIALAYGRALVAASEVLLALEQTSESAPPDPANTLPLYPPRKTLS